MRIHTRFFAVRVGGGRVSFRIGSYDHGVSGKVARGQSHLALTWGIARWTLG